MRLIACPVIVILVLAVPAGAMALSQSCLAQHAGVAAIVLWLAAVGWGFHAMLHKRLAAEDRLAQLESHVAVEHDAYVGLRRTTQACTAALEAEWLGLQACLCTGDRCGIEERMHALQAAIVSLRGPA